MTGLTRDPIAFDLGGDFASDMPRAAPEVRLWWTLLVFAALLRTVIMPYGGFPTDIGTFKGWATALAERGPEAFYGSGFADYLPGYLYVLWLIGELHAHLRFSDQALLFLIKLPAAIADLLGAALLRRVAGTFTSSRVALLAAALTAGVTLTVLNAPFHVGPGGLGTLLRNAVGVYPYGSVVAFNLWGAVQGFWHSDADRLVGLPVYLWGTIASALGVAAVLGAVWRRPTDRTVTLAAAAVLVATFLLPTRIHERYLLPALPPPPAVRRAALQRPGDTGDERAGPPPPPLAPLDSLAPPGLAGAGFGQIPFGQIPIEDQRQENDPRERHPAREGGPQSRGTGGIQSARLPNGGHRRLPAREGVLIWRETWPGASGGKRVHTAGSPSSNSWWPCPCLPPSPS